MSIRAIRQYILLLAATLALVGCRIKNNSQHIMHDIFVDILENKKNTIDLADYTDFRWDKAYIFMYKPDEPLPSEKEVGFDCFEVFHYRGDGDLIWPIIFVRSGEIVYQEDLVRDYPTIRAEKDNAAQMFMEVKREQSEINVKVEGKSEVVFYSKKKRIINRW